MRSFRIQCAVQIIFIASVTLAGRLSTDRGSTFIDIPTNRHRCLKGIPEVASLPNVAVAMVDLTFSMLAGTAIPSDVRPKACDASLFWAHNYSETRSMNVAAGVSVFLMMHCVDEDRYFPSGEVWRKFEQAGFVAILLVFPMNMPFMAGFLFQLRDRFDTNINIPFFFTQLLLKYSA